MMTIKCTHINCDKNATTYFIIEPGEFACDEHSSGDYHWELEDEK
jgi:hypothetical protein